MKQISFILQINSLYFYFVKKIQKIKKKKNLLKIILLNF